MESQKPYLSIEFYEEYAEIKTMHLNIENLTLLMEICHKYNYKYIKSNKDGKGFKLVKNECR